MNIQTALRQWSGSTLDKAHRELGVEAADRLDVLEKALTVALDVIEDVDTYSHANKHPAYGLLILALEGK